MATRSDRRRLAPGFKSAWILAAGLLAGCGPTQIASEHRDLVLRLATGTSTRDQAIIDRAAGDIKRLEDSGDLTDDEKEAFHTIILAANAGEWDRAQTSAYTLRDAQEPTDEDLERVRNRVVRKIKKFDRKQASRSH